MSCIGSSYTNDILHIIIDIGNDFIMFLQPAVHATELESSETILQDLGCGSGLALASFPGHF